MQLFIENFHSKSKMLFNHYHTLLNACINNGCRKQMRESNMSPCCQLVLGLMFTTHDTKIVFPMEGIHLCAMRIAVIMITFL